MEESEAQRFLNIHRSKIIQRVRNVESLVDFLSGKSILTKEMADKIYTQKTDQAKMREVYSHLNSSRGYELTLEWLKEKEPDMIQELEENSDADLTEPPRKRVRSSALAVDQVDSEPNIPNLKCLSTFPKFEEWVSKTSEDLITTLKTKLANGEIDALETELKDKKLKKGLYFSVNDIMIINKNTKLKLFFETCKDAKFPDLPIKLFFLKDQQHAPSATESKTEKDDESCPDEEVFNDKVTDSALGSSYSSSYGSSLQHFSQVGDLFNTYDSTQLMNALHNVKTTTESKPHNANLPITDAPCPSATLNVAGDDPMQSEGPQKNLDPKPLARFKNTDLPSQKECQNGSLVHADGDITPSDEAMDMQEMPYKLNIQPTGELLTHKPCVAEPILSTSLGVAADDHNLEKPLDLQESEANMQCDPEVSNNETLVKYGCEDVVDSIMQSGVPQMVCDPGSDITNQRQELPEANCQNGSQVQKQHEDKCDVPLQEGMDIKETGSEPHMRPQKSNILKQAEDPQVDLCQGPDCKEDTPLEQPSSVQESEPNMRYDSRLIKPGPFTAEPLQSISLEASADDLMQSEDPECTQERKDSHSVPPGEKTDMLPQMSFFLKQTSDLCDAVRPDGKDHALLEKHLDLQKSDESLQCDPEVGNNEPLVEYGREGVVNSIMQGGVPQMVHDPDPLTELKSLDSASQKECPRSDVTKQRQEFPEANWQNRSQVQKQHEDKDDAPLQEATDIKKTGFKPHTPPPKSDPPKQAEDPQVDLCQGPYGKEDTPLKQPLRVQEIGPNMRYDPKLIKNGPYTAEPFQSIPLEAMQESKVRMQRDPEGANRQPLVKYGLEGVVVNRVMQNGVPSMNCDPDPFTEFEGTDLAFQKERRVSDIPKQRQELPEVQNGSLAQMQYKPPLQEAMDMQETSVETNIQPAGESLTGKSFAGVPLPTTLGSAVVNPVQTEGLKATEEQSTSRPIPLFDKTDVPSQKSNEPKQVDHPTALCQRPDIADSTSLQKPLDLQKSNENMQFNTKTPVPDGLSASQTLQGQDGNGTGLTGISEAANNQTNKPSYRDSGNFSLDLDDGQAGFCSTPLTDSAEKEGKKTGRKLKSRQQQEEEKLKKINEQRRLLYEWAKKRLPRGREDEIKEVLDRISIENQVEHREYPCFVAENIMVYEDLKSGERQIIVIDDKTSSEKNPGKKKKPLPKDTKTWLNYHMWVCGVQKAVLINQEEQEVPFDEKFLEGIKTQCEKFVFEALAPALAVFKNVQRQERLYSLINNH